MRFLTARKKLAALVLATVLLAGCGPLQGFRSAFNGSKPFIQTLATQRVITQVQADTAIADVDDGIKSAERGERCLNAVTVSGRAKQVAKAKCYFQVAQDLRVILGRHNFGGNPQLDQIATIINGAIEAFEAYFNDVTVEHDAKVFARSSGGIQTSDTVNVNVDADKGLESTLKSLNKQLKAVTGK